MAINKILKFLLDNSFEIFEEIIAVDDNHAKSIQICSKNIIPTPQIDHKIIESEINLNPIVNHQIIKNGFNALKSTPARNGPCFV